MKERNSISNKCEEKDDLEFNSNLKVLDFPKNNTVVWKKSNQDSSDYFDDFDDFLEFYCEELLTDFKNKKNREYLLVTFKNLIEFWKITPTPFDEKFLFQNNIRYVRKKNRKIWIDEIIEGFHIGDLPKKLSVMLDDLFSLRKIGISPSNEELFNIIQQEMLFSPKE
eukprot:gene6652-10817_t